MINQSNLNQYFLFPIGYIDYTTFKYIFIKGFNTIYLNSEKRIVIDTIKIK